FAIGEHERIVTIEDAAELRLPQPNVVALETRPPSVEGTGAIDVRSLLRAALRMRPDRIVVGEVRGGEALDMLQAMNTGHRGSLTTAHANGARHAPMRIETLALMAGIDLPRQGARARTCSAGARRGGCGRARERTLHPARARRDRADTPTRARPADGARRREPRAWRAPRRRASVLRACRSG